MSHPLANPGRLVVVVDESWRRAQLPPEDIEIQPDQLPDPDDDAQESLKEVERRWNELALDRIVNSTTQRRLR